MGGGGGGRGGSGRGRGGYGGGYQMDDPVSDDPSDGGGFYGGPRGNYMIIVNFKNTL